jgi:multidrug efflux system outer membrane protein
MKKLKKKIIFGAGIICVSFLHNSCTLPKDLGRKEENKNVPAVYAGVKDSTNTAKTKWKDFFKDSNLVSLIDTALKNNQELNITLQEINIAKFEVRARKGQYLPFANIGAGAGVEKVGRYTSQGANDANTDILPGKPFPDPLPNYMIGADISWEVDIWKKLRNAKKAAVYKYLSSVDGKNFMVTKLIAEISNSYYELMALDNQLDILKKNIDIQQNALEIVKLEKDAARVTELAVRKFEAEVLKNQSRQFYILQQITETENRINFLVGRFPRPIERNSKNFSDFVSDSIYAGIPSQLLKNRPDIRQAEQQLSAAKMDVKAAKAEFYPSLMIRAGAGYQAFNPQYLIQTPQSLLYSMAGNLAAPLINRNAIKANYFSSNSKQIQAVYNFERSILNAHMEVVNQLSNISNLKKSYDLKSKQVQALTKSIDISTTLFKSARADYMEVLMTQRDALESKFELIETKKQQMNAMVNIYRALGGGWN